MTTQVPAFAAFSSSSPLQPHLIERRDLKPSDVAIEILYCGVCHSDIHTVRSEWGEVSYPIVPGHEIVGKITGRGKKVKKHKLGDIVGVGCFVDSCGKCAPCKTHEEFLCEKGAAYTYDSHEVGTDIPTQGGYSKAIVVHEDYVLKIKKNQPLERIAPLLCAGITTYSPLKRQGLKKGHKLGVIGLGGLGHMAVKIGKAMGASVTIFSTSEEKRADAKKLGAKEFVNTRSPEAFKNLKGDFDFILNTVSASFSLDPYLDKLKIGGAIIVVGVPPLGLNLGAMSLIRGRKRVVGSLIGGIKETQEMLDFCAKKKIFADVELIPASEINGAYERVLKGDVKYRFVIDATTL